jgi:hypothetical protein
MIQNKYVSSNWTLSDHCFRDATTICENKPVELEKETDSSKYT